ncbi:hypothetical protein CYFUS_005985 [Cystobacter fuscus]|uniref:Uncharacterized protein n=1 Tax=Cystobacter fuscus TaxID=43 RepID=A0A250JBI3_9BACT|nr:hypothetical protein CYFUS_005985 [Cystobacter fuscus]
MGCGGSRRGRIAQALDSAIIADIVQTYPMVDLFLILVDRDGAVTSQRTSQAAQGPQTHWPTILEVVLWLVRNVRQWALVSPRNARQGA